MGDELSSGPKISGCSEWHGDKAGYILILARSSAFLIGRRIAINCRAVIRVIIDVIWKWPVSAHSNTQGKVGRTFERLFLRGENRIEIWIWNLLTVFLMLASNRFRISPIVESLLTREMPPNKWVGLYYYISVDLWSYFGRRPRCGCASVSACCPWRPEKGEPSRHGHEPKWSLRTIGTEYWSHGQHPCPTLVRHQLFPAFDNGQSRWPALSLMHPRGGRRGLTTFRWSIAHTGLDPTPLGWPDMTNEKHPHPYHEPPIISSVCLNSGVCIIEVQAQRR